MNKRIAVVAATPQEVQPFLNFLQKDATQHSLQSFQHHQLQIDLLYTGIGVMQSTYNLMDYISHRHPDGWVQVGIGGAFDRSLLLTSVYRITSEMLVGFGAQEQDGTIKDPFQLGWMEADDFPYKDGLLPCHFAPKSDLPHATGMTSFYAHGQATTISILEKGTTGQIENMEGAPFFYISLVKKIPFLSFRAISNYVEPRNKEDWQIEGAINNLCQTTIQWISEHDFNVDKMFGIGALNHE